MEPITRQQLLAADDAEAFEYPPAFDYEFAMAQVLAVGRRNDDRPRWRVDLNRSRHISRIALFTAFVACTSLAAPAARTATFGVPTQFAVGDSLAYPDGLAVTLERIDDSRCPPKAQCIWAGELAPTFTLRVRGQPAREARLGTMRAKSASAGAYRLALGDVTPVAATVTVTVTK